MWKLNNAFPKTKPVGQSKDQKGGKPESNGNRNNIPKLMELIYYVHSFSMHVLSNLKCSCTEINWTCLFSCSVQFSHSVMSDSLQPMDCSMPGLPVHHQLPELTQLISIESVMPSNHLILCRLLLLPPSIFPSIRVFSNESALCIRWPEYWSFSFNISPSNENSGLISFRMDWLDLLAVQGTHKSLLQHHSSKASILLCSAFFTVQL